MPRPDPKAPRAGQESLFEALGETRQGQVLRGRHSEAMDRALDAGKPVLTTKPFDSSSAETLRVTVGADISKRRAAAAKLCASATARNTLISWNRFTPCGLRADFGKARQSSRKRISGPGFDGILYELFARSYGYGNRALF